MERDLKAWVRDGDIVEVGLEEGKPVFTMSRRWSLRNR
jgi:hypothetical protein